MYAKFSQKANFVQVDVEQRIKKPTETKKAEKNRNQS